MTRLVARRTGSNFGTVVRALFIGAAFVAMNACGDSTAPPTPALIAFLSGGTITATVGQVIDTPLSIEVRDDKGKVLTGIAFTVTVTGGGTLVGTPAKTTTQTLLGTWTLGTVAGMQTLQVHAGSALLTISANALAGIPTASSTSATSLNVAGGVGATSSVQPSITIKDAFGNAIVGRAITVQVTGGGSVQSSTPVTDASGTATVGLWTFGTVAGDQSVILTPGGSANPVVFRATVAPGPPTTVTPLVSTTQTGTVGAPVAAAPSLRVTDAFGNAISGIAVTAVASGTGSIGSSAGTTDANGSFSVGTWTLGTVPGAYTVTLTAQGFAPIVFTATAAAGLPASISIAAGSGQTATVNTALPVNPSFRVADQFNNPVGGQNVLFVVLTGAGTLASPTAVTDAQGLASPGAWTLGAVGGQQSIRAAVGGLTVTLTATATGGGGGGGGGGSAYNIDVRFFGSTPAAAVLNAFTAAATRIQQIVTADLPDVVVNANVDGCLFGAGVINETVDDLLILAQVIPIDGVGGTLGSAGWCGARSTGGRQTFLGVMQFDAADMANMVADGSINSVVLHEMLHILGVGARWPNLSLIQGANTANSLVIGAQSRTAYLAAGGTAPVGVPAENCLNLSPGNTANCGAGTRDSHWKESVFVTELMTGFLNSGVFAPLSAITIANLADLNYTVSFATADPYSVPPPGGLMSSQPSTAHVIDMGAFRRPQVFELDGLGHIVRVLRPPPY